MSKCDEVSEVLSDQMSKMDKATLFIVRKTSAMLPRLSRYCAGAMLCIIPVIDDRIQNYSLKNHNDCNKSIFSKWLFGSDTEQ